MKKLQKRVMFSKDTIEAYYMPCGCGCVMCGCSCSASLELSDDRSDTKSQLSSDTRYDNKKAELEP